MKPGDPVWVRSGGEWVIGWLLERYRERCKRVYGWRTAFECPEGYWVAGERYENKSDLRPRHLSLDGADKPED